MGSKGRGHGPRPPPPPPPAAAAKAAARAADKGVAKPALSPNANAPQQLNPAGPVLGVADALALHKFRRIGVQTKVTSRAAVEAAFAAYVPSRIREANKTWQQFYGAPDPEAGAVEGPWTLAADDHGAASNRSRKTVTFAQGAGGLHAEIINVVVDHAAPNCPAPWSLGAGVSKTYSLAILARWKAQGGPCDCSWPLLPARHDPDVVWSALGPKQKFVEALATAAVEPGAEMPPPTPGSVRFVCISDTHGRHRELTARLPPGDVLLHAGDFTMRGELDVVTDFGKWLRSLPFAKKFVVAGNHDLCFDRQVSMDSGRALLEQAGGETVQYLEDASTTYRGLRIFGSPWQPEFGEGWVFGLPRGPELAAKWAAVPMDVDVLLTHSPPLGRNDACRHGGRAGCADLLSAVQTRVRPAFCVYGHIHEDPGASSDGVTSYVNATSCDFDYKCTRPPLVFDLPARTSSEEGLPPSPAPPLLEMP